MNRRSMNDAGQGSRGAGEQGRGYQSKVYQNPKSSIVAEVSRRLAPKIDQKIIRKFIKNVKKILDKFIKKLTKNLKKYRKNLLGKIRNSEFGIRVKFGDLGHSEFGF